MENTIFKSAMFIHVIAGIISLITGLIGMLSKKGSKLHNKLGIVFYYAMCIIFITTVLFFIIYPDKVKYQFFLGVGIISFYPNWSGKRMLSFKKVFNPLPIDKIMAIAIGFVGIGMFIYAYLLKSNADSDSQLLKILFVVFGITCLLNSYGDVTAYFGFRKIEKLHWLFAHGGKMLGAYTAAVTAFSVNIVPRMLPKNMPDSTQMFIWLTPILVFSVLGQIILKRYKKKLKVA
jgi:hypothetical protein